MEWSLRLLWELLRPWWYRLNRGLWLTLAHWLRTFFDGYHVLAVFSFYPSIEYLKERSDEKSSKTKETFFFSQRHVL